MSERANRGLRPYSLIMALKLMAALSSAIRAMRSVRSGPRHRR
jgi:hypothetical protein